ncbi:unnamed protein product, partial [marine sediment metagenome]
MSHPEYYTDVIKNMSHLQELSRQIMWYDSVIKNLADRCMDTVSGECEDYNTLIPDQLQEPYMIKDMINTMTPVKIILPQNCNDRKRLFTHTKDETYEFYMGGNIDQNYSLYCSDMDSEDDPKEYLLLNKISP